MMLYLIRKTIISFEFLILVLFFTCDLDSAFLKILNGFVVAQSLLILSIASPAFFFLIWKAFFPEKDDRNVIKGFLEKEKLYLINVVAIFYYVLFSMLIFLSNFYKSFHPKNLPLNYPAMALFGIIVLLATMGINHLYINIILRDRS